MCYHTKLSAKTEKIEVAFKARFSNPGEYVPKEEINGFDFSKTPVITNKNPEKIQLFHWGLIPHWAPDDSIKKLTLNAKIETADEKRAFRDAIENRCLIIAEGFYEWHWFDKKGREKQKYLIETKNRELFAFAGIYSTWINPINGNAINSYSILTTQANELMSDIHNIKKRMPVILKEDDHQKWLRNFDLKHFDFPYEVELKATKIGQLPNYRLEF